MMAFANTEDPGARGAAMLHSSFKFFKTGDSESRLALS
jgi:hypothetical protein